MDNLKDGNAVPERARYALTYLMQSGLWRPNADNMIRPSDPILRRDALFLLLNWTESVRPDILSKGTFVTAKGDDAGAGSNAAISVKRGKQTYELRLSDKPRLFRIDAGRPIPVSSIKILGNEKLSFLYRPFRDNRFPRN